ncbi:MAG: hypothetical protein KDD53_03890, partial [Bdellovibrionales bacterium]|nr:hypothetical protein [Bdellovibrionales bacterium]
LLSILERMGCQIEQGVQGQLSWISVTGPDKLKCVNADMSLLPDSAQTLAVVASVADGTSYITGLSTLRHKETDRIKALMNELNKIGIKSEEYQDGIAVHGGNPTAATIATYQDHRMAMSFACLACKVKDLIIEQPTVVSKSFPQFWNYLADMGFEIEYV